MSYPVFHAWSYDPTASDGPWSYVGRFDGAVSAFAALRDRRSAWFWIGVYDEATSGARASGSDVSWRGLRYSVWAWTPGGWVALEGGQEAWAAGSVSSAVSDGLARGFMAQRLA